MKTMETKKNQNHIVITMNSEDEKQKLPMNLIIHCSAILLFGASVSKNSFLTFES